MCVEGELLVNLPPPPHPQSSCAAQFIANNIHPEFTGAWLHVDMAALVHTNERGTGYGVALLLDLFV